MDRQMPPNVSFLSGRDTAPAYWMYNILWVPLIQGHQTGGSFSVIEQWMRKDSGALVPHVHNFCDEWFHMIDGTIEFTVSAEKLPAKAGENVWVARGTVHSFVVTSDVCHVLNGYTPMTIQERASSRPRCFLTGSGISIGDATFPPVRLALTNLCAALARANPLSSPACR